MRYPQINEQIAEFGVYWVRNQKLEKLEHIRSVNDYSHWLYELHHYIKEQQYYRYPERYVNKQKLILLPKYIHRYVHSAIKDKTFLLRYGFSRDLVLYRNRKVEDDA